MWQTEQAGYKKFFLKKKLCKGLTKSPLIFTNLAYAFPILHEY